MRLQQQIHTLLERWIPSRKQPFYFCWCTCSVVHDGKDLSIFVWSPAVNAVSVIELSNHGPVSRGLPVKGSTAHKLLLLSSLIRSSWSYSHENGPLRSSTSVSSSHHAKMWGVNHAIFGIIRNAMSYSITRWNMTIFWRANFMLYHFKSKICFFINIYFHQTQSARANRYHWILPPLKNIVPYSICFASIIRAKEAFFNKTNEIISYNMHAVAMDTTTKPF